MLIALPVGRALGQTISLAITLIVPHVQHRTCSPYTWGSIVGLASCSGAEQEFWELP